MLCVAYNLPPIHQLRFGRILDRIGKTNPATVFAPLMDMQRQLVRGQPVYSSHPATKALAGRIRRRGRSPLFSTVFHNNRPTGHGFSRVDAERTSVWKRESALRLCLFQAPLTYQHTFHGTNLLGIRRMSRATSGRMIYSDGILSSSINSRSFVPLMLSCSSESCGHTLAFVNVRQAWQ